MDDIQEEIESDINDQNNKNNELDNKLKKMLVNGGWNDKNERVIISIGENAASYKWMHEKSSMYYQNINKILGITMIIFSTALTAETIIPNNQTGDVINVFRRIFTYIITVTTVIQNFLKLEKLTEQHLSICNDFGRLYHDIQQQMCMYKRDRQNAVKYMTIILKQYDTLVVNGPSIPNRVINNFKNIFKNSDISIPDIADKIQKIEIMTEEPLHRSIKGGNSDGGINSGINSGISGAIEMNNLINNNTTNYHNLNNLHQISDALRVTDDICDDDIINFSHKSLKKKLNEYQYDRWKQQHSEFD